MYQGAPIALSMDSADGSLMTVTASAPEFIAAVPDVLARTLTGDADFLACHGLHYSEQDGTASGAYAHEREVLGPAAMTEVVQLARPWQRNVVWTDRFHLVASGASPAAGGRLLGLYAGGRGQLTLCQYHVSMTAAVAQAIAALPHQAGIDGWLQAGLQSLGRWTAHYDERAPQNLRVAVSPVVVPTVTQAIRGLGA